MRKFGNNRNSLSKTWKVINKLLRGKTTSYQIINIIDKDRILTDGDAITNALNNFLTSIGPPLAEKISDNNVKSIDFFLDSGKNSIFLFPSNSDEEIQSHY